MTDFYICVCKENEMKVHVVKLKFVFDFWQLCLFSRHVLAAFLLPHAHDGAVTWNVLPLFQLADSRHSGLKMRWDSSSSVGLIWAYINIRLALCLVVGGSVKISRLISWILVLLLHAVHEMNQKYTKTSFSQSPRNILNRDRRRHQDSFLFLSPETVLRSVFARWHLSDHPLHNADKLLIYLWRYLAFAGCPTRHQMTQQHVGAAHRAGTFSQ